MPLISGKRKVLSRRRPGGEGKAVKYSQFQQKLAAKNRSRPPATAAAKDVRPLVASFARLSAGKRYALRP
jgi:hypothetical protein